MSAPERRTRGDFSPCRSCRRQVRWAKSAKSGKPMPLDEDAVRGNVLIDAYGVAHVFGDHVKAMQAADGDVNLYGAGPATYISHHADGQCPQGRAWQGKRRGDPDAPKAPEPAQGSLLGPDEPTNAIVGG